MALAENHFPLSERPAAWRRLLRFAGRSVLAAAIASASLGLIHDQAQRVRDERLFEYPLIVAMEESGVSIAESELLVVAPIETGPEPSLTRLKEIASRVARALPGAEEASLWSDTGDAYAVVYFEGVEPAGGKWVASARYIAGHAGGGGRIEAAVHRSFLGVPKHIAQMARSTKGLIDRAVGRPLYGGEATVTFRGRPPQGTGREEMARRLLSAVGADLRYESHDATKYVAAGLTSRLPGRTQLARQTVNVVISVSRLGIGQWVEVESPAI